MSLGLPASRGRLRVSGTLLGVLWLTLPASAQATDPQGQLALRDVVRAAYVRAGQIRTEAEIDALSVSARPLVTFDPRAATEADIVGLVGRLGLTDASAPKPPAPVSLTRTLARDPLPAYGGVDLTGQTAVDLAGMLQRGETTSREIVLQYLYKIQQLDHAGPALRSVEQINPDILALADRADAQRMEAQRQGQTLPPLFGVPVLLKMNIGTADDLRTTAGSAALIGSRPATEATLVSGMLEQGLLIMGKANMGQWAGLTSNNRSDTGGQTISPFDPAIAVAGSSSGPSIAAAMRFAPLTVGSQTSDSIIYPAQQQGLYALKPTAGLISTTGIAPYSQQIDTAGPMGNSVPDLALALNGMVKRDTTDTRSSNVVRPAGYNAGLTGDLTGLKIGIYHAPSSEDPQRPAQFDSLVGGMLTAANAAIVSLDRAGVDAAVRTAVRAMSDDDLAQFVTLADSSAQIPTDPTARAAFLNDYRQTFTDGAGRVEAATNGAVPFYFYDAYVSISNYLAARVSSPDDYKSALVRLLGDKLSRLNVDPKVFARTIEDLAAFAQKNPGLTGDAALSFLAVDKVGPYATSDAFNRAYANWIRISTALMSNVRAALGVDAVIGFLGTDDNTNDGRGLFSFSTEQTSTSPQLNVPFQVGGVPANILIDANPYQEQTLLRIGQALQQQLISDRFRHYQATAPNPPATGYGNDQPDDSGPLLPLVLKNLDDHGRTTTAHLLTTEMAPLVLDVAGATTPPHFDGRISGNGGLIKDGAGIQLLTGTSDFTGGVFVWQGGLAVDKTEALGAPSNTVTLEDKSALIATHSLLIGRPVILSNGGTLGALAGATLTEDAVVSGNGGLSKTGLGRLNLLADNTYAGGTHILAGTVSVSREANLGQAYGAVTIGDGAALEATASFTTTRPFTLEGISGLAVDPAQTLTVSNVVSGPGTLFKLGLGTLTLSGTNTFSGGVVLAGGTVSASQDANLGGPSGPLAFEGGILQVAGTAFTATTRPITWGPSGGGLDIADPANTLTLAQALSGPGGLTKRGSGTLTLTGASTYTGGTAIAAGTLGAANAAALGTGPATVAAAGTLDVTNVTLANALTLAGTGAGGVGALTGTGTAGVSGAVTLAGNAALGGSGTLILSGAIGDGGNGHGLSKLGTGTAILTGANSYSGATTIWSGTLALAGAGSLSASGGVALATGASFDIAGLTGTGTTIAGLADTAVGQAGTVALGARTLTISGASGSFGGGISGTGGLSLTAGTQALTGASTYTGLTTVAGGTLSLAGAGSISASGGVALATGASLDISGLTGTGTTISRLSDTAAGQAGTVALGAKSLTLADAGGSFGGTITGTGGLSLTGGRQILTGRNTYSGATTVADATLEIDGVLAASAVTVRRGGTLSGTGKIGDPLIEAGGRLAPGSAASIGTLAIHGPLTFAPGAFYTVRITPTSNDRTDVTGPVTIQGGTVQVLAGSGTYTPALRYTLLTVTGGITGPFTSLQTSSNLAFLTPSLCYETHGIALGFAQTAPLASVATSPNQARIATALNGTGPTVTTTPTTAGGAPPAVTTKVSATGTVTTTVSTGTGTTTVVSSPAAQVTTAVLNQTAPGAVRALNSLSGEIQGSAVTVRAQAAFAVQGTLLEHLRFGAGPAGGFGLTGSVGQRFAPGTTLPAGYAAFTPDEPAAGLVLVRPLAPRYGIWGQAFGVFGASEASRNAARLTRETGGFLLGAETGPGVLGDGLGSGLDGWRFGVAGGSGFTQFDVTARQSSGRIEGSLGGAYASGTLGPVQVRLLALYGRDALDTRRTVLLPGFSQAITGRAGGSTLQGFGEVGYRIGGGERSVEPFVGGAVLRLRRDGFTETGGTSALAAFGRSDLIETATAGVQAQAAVADLFGGAGPLLARGLIAYRRAFGDVVPAARLAFRGDSRAFRTAGAPLARDAAVTSAGLDWQVAPGTLVGVSYDGQLGRRARDHAVKSSLSYRW